MAEIVKKTLPETPAPKAPGRSVIESEVFDASRKARIIVQEAQAKAQHLLGQAERDGAKIREMAHEKGFEAGRDEGLAKFEAAIVAVNRENQELLAQAEEQLLSVAVGVAQAVIGRELAVNPRAIVDIVRKAIQPMNRKKALTLRINPADRDALDRGRAEILEAMLSGGTVHLVPDPDISRGGCVVETEHGTVDARLETQLSVFSHLLTGDAHYHEADYHEPTASVGDHPAEIISPVAPIETQEPEINPGEETFEDVDVASVDEPASFISSPAFAAEEIGNEEAVFDDITPTEKDLHTPEERAGNLQEVAQDLQDGVDVNELLKSLDEYLGKEK